MADVLEALVSRLRFRHLRLLVELQRAGTLGRAAERLHLSQPALSKTLKEVEAVFGFALFERGARGLAITTQGEVVVAGATAMLAELRHLGEAARASTLAPVAVLHLGAPAAVAAGGVLPAVLARLQESEARLVVELREDAVPRLFNALVAGELDALLTSYNQAAFAAPRPTRLLYERCGAHGYAVIAPPAHPLAGRRRVRWSELSGERWILPHAELLSRQALEGQFLRAGADTPVPWVVSDSPATNVQLVAAGVGLASVPWAMAETEARHGRVVRLPLPMTPSRVPSALVYRAASKELPAVRALRKAVQGLGLDRAR